MDDQLHMLDLDHRPPHNRWTQQQRITLCLLHRFYRKDYHGYKEVFNNIFRQELGQCGLKTGLLCRVLNTQWDDMRRHGHAVWHEVHVQTPFDRNGVWSNDLQQIDATTNMLGLMLEEKDNDDINTANFVLRTPRINASVQITDH